MIELPDEMSIRQKTKPEEILGARSANSYQVFSNDQSILLSVDEVPTPHWEGRVTFRQTTLRGWTKNPLTYRNQNQSPFLRASHPIRWFFDRVELHTTDGKPVGAIQARFRPLRRIFDIENEKGKVVIKVSTGVLQPWSYTYRKDGSDIAYLKKEWKGVLREALTSEDSFNLKIVRPQLDPIEKLLILASGIYVDLKYFNRPVVRLEINSR